MRDFGEVLQDIDQGKVTLEAAKQLRRVVAAVTATGIKGSLTLTLEVEPAGDAVLIGSKLVAKAPAAATETTLFHIGIDGDLGKPQLDLPLGRTGQGPGARGGLS